ncbi:sensor histidine kinase [Streptomyces flavalbus]|uniref:Oxygen sensor histidine kinase NreB n=1 Tax=Streptomyces flavalbus TaxID=2665155 RepID=A0ABW2WI62_9ACTN
MTATPGDLTRGPARPGPGPDPDPDPDPAPDLDEWWLTAALRAAFVLLVGGSVARLLTHDAGNARTGVVLTLLLLFAAVYLLGQVLAPASRHGERPTVRHLVWLGVVLALWLALLVLAPSATWCAVPLLFTGLHRLPVRIAVPLAGVVVLLVVGAEIRVFADTPQPGAFNPNLVAAPVALGAVATAVLVHSRRLTARQRRLIEDLVRTRGELAASERHAGILAERQRLSAEIHDTLAQSLSSQRMLLQAAERHWDTAPDTARDHVRDAAEVTGRALDEVRRFVRDLAPLDLAGSTLVPALRDLAARGGEPGTTTVEFRLDGPDPGPLPEPVEAALLRVAQGALANVREHSGATRAVLTLTCMEDRVTVDVADDGRGFDPDRAPRRGRARLRGHGLPVMQARARQAGGTLTVESAPGRGTVVTVSVPLGTGTPVGAAP